jgi:hypothetical protein
MSLKEQKEKLIEEECSMCPYSNSRECDGCPIDPILDRLATSEEKVKHLSEALNKRQGDFCTMGCSGCELSIKS